MRIGCNFTDTGLELHLIAGELNSTVLIPIIPSSRNALNPSN